MKTLKIALACVATMLLVTSCLKDKESYQAGFSRLTSVKAYHFANDLSDQLVVESYGNWDITSSGQPADWCQLSPLRGYAGSSTVEVTFSENKTGKSRQTVFSIADRDHADEAYSTFVIGQLATRGDGSLGNAAAVKSITGSDGSRVEATYDELHRPLTATIKKADELLWKLEFKYAPETMTVETNHGQFTADMTYDYQPSKQLVNGASKVSFKEDEYFNLLSSQYAFQIVYYQNDDNYEGLSYLMPSVRCLLPDSLHNADSLKYIRSVAGNVELTKMKPTYSQIDNRCQSVDVNQLLLGVERCNPFLLFSLFRQARNTSIISELKTGSDNITVKAELNADKSVRQLQVTRGGEAITYTFEYE